MAEQDEIGPVFARFVGLIARLRAPGGCPWDREQTHSSLRPMTVEEAYEVIEAIDSGDAQALKEELGDLLLQVVFHSDIAREAGHFTIADVVGVVADKMVRRHPHVFAGQKASTPEEVLRNWEAMKTEERRAAQKEAPGGSMLDSVSKALPAMIEGALMSTKASRVGFDWKDTPAVLGKLDEEVRELKEALARDGAGARSVEEELGDLLFVALNVARVLGSDPESALKAANRKFRERFRYVEERLREKGKTPTDSSPAEMDALWEEAKRRGAPPA